MKFGILKEGKTPPDERVPLIPSQVKELIDKGEADFVVQHSNVRRIKDAEFQALDIPMSDDVSDADVIINVKEVKIADLVPGKTHMFFSHTIKKQPYNRDLLRAILDKKIRLIDWETLTHENGPRIIGFGKYAGIVGTYNTFRTYGLRYKAFDLKKAHSCEDRAEMEGELAKVKLPDQYKIVLTGGGRVAKGALEIINKLGLKEVSPSDFLNETFNEPVYTVLQVNDYYSIDGSNEFNKKIAYSHPEMLKSDFMKYAKVADMYISCHYYDDKAPFIFTREDAKSPNFNIKIVGDISCDIDGPVACTLRPSTIADPIYGYDAVTESEVAFDAENAISVMAVDNLPCELPRDASKDFGIEFMQHVYPQFFNGDKGTVLQRATIAQDGKLTEKFAYLQDYVDGTEVGA